MPGRVQQAPAPPPPHTHTTGTVGQEVALDSVMSVFWHLLASSFEGAGKWGPLERCTVAVKIPLTTLFLLSLVLEASLCCLPEMFPGGLPCDVNLFYYLVHNPVSLQTQLFSKSAQQGVSRIEPLSLETAVRFSLSSRFPEKTIG